MNRKYWIVTIVLLSLGILILFFEKGKNPLYGAFIYLNLDNGIEGEASPSLTEDYFLEEKFYADFSNLRAISFRTVTWNRAYSSDQFLYVELRNESGDIVDVQKIQATSLPDNEICTVYFPDIFLNRGVWYTLRFYSNSLEQQPGISVMTNNKINTDKAYSTTGDSKNINIIVYGG